MVANLEKDLNSVRRSRLEKTRRFMKERREYMRDVVKAIELIVKQAHKKGLIPAIRLNGSSDIAFEGIACERDGAPYKNLMDAFPGVQFIDYTKNAKRLLRDLPANYHLTLSHTGENIGDCFEALYHGKNVAVVFDALPETFHGFPVIDGDKHDLRHLDPKSVVVGLLPKGSKAKKDQSGFVVRRVADLATAA